MAVQRGPVNSTADWTYILPQGSVACALLRVADCKLHGRLIKKKKIRNGADLIKIWKGEIHPCAEGQCTSWIPLKSHLSPQITFMKLIRFRESATRGTSFYKCSLSGFQLSRRSGKGKGDQKSENWANTRACFIAVLCARERERKRP